MSELNLLEAWSLWKSDSLPKDSMLFGITILWWGRIGIFLGFAAALGIIPTLIGYRRIYAAGRNLRAEFQVGRNFALSIAAFADSVLFLKYVYGDESSDPFDYAKERFKNFQFGLIVIIFLPCLALWCYFVLWGVWSAMIDNPGFWLRFDGFVEFSILLFAIGIAVGMALAALISAAIMFLFMIVLAIFSLALFQPIGWLLSRPSLRIAVRTGSIACLISGAHFSLLAS